MLTCLIYLGLTGGIMLKRAQRVARRRGMMWVLVCALLVLPVVALGTVPRLLRAERRAVVGACPIAYVGVDERVHLTSVDANIGIELAGPNAEGRIWFSYSPPMWSPDGALIAYQVAGGGDVKEIALLDPWGGHFWLLATGRSGGFAGWISDRYLVEQMRVRHAHTGKDARKFHGGWHVAPAPGNPGRSVTAHPGRGIRIMDEERVDTQLTGGERADWVPRIDPTGSWVAWTSRDPEQLQRRLGRSLGGGIIGIKAVNEPTDAKPQYVGWEFESAFFCDWTDDGRILANVRNNGRWGLVILDKEGKLLRRVPTDVPPAPESGASWRRTPRAAG